MFAGPPDLTTEQRQAIVTEEAWISASKQPAAHVSPSLAGITTTFVTPTRSIAARSRSSAPRRTCGCCPLIWAAGRPADPTGDPHIIGDLAWSDGAGAAGPTSAGFGREDPGGHRDGRCRHHPEPTDGRQLRHMYACRAGRCGSSPRCRNSPVPPRPSIAGGIGSRAPSSPSGNAPTALFRLLELIGQGAPRPAVILGFPVGFVGAMESKEALIAPVPACRSSPARAAAAARSPPLPSTRWPEIRRGPVAHRHRYRRRRSLRLVAVARALVETAELLVGGERRQSMVRRSRRSG